MNISDTLLLAAERIDSEEDKGGCCVSIAKVEHIHGAGKAALNFFEKHFKPIEVVDNNYWFGSPKFAGGSNEDKNLRVIAMCLASAVAKKERRRSYGNESCKF